MTAHPATPRTAPAPRRTLRRRLQADRGFTIVEMVVVLVIMGILLALIVPRFGSARKTTNIKNTSTAAMALGQAISAFQLDHGGRSPDAGTQDWPELGTGPVDLEGRPYLRPQTTTAFADGSVQLEADEAATEAAPGVAGKVVYTPLRAGGDANATAMGFRLLVYPRQGDGFASEPACQVTDGAAPAGDALAGVPDCG